MAYIALRQMSLHQISFVPCSIENFSKLIRKNILKRNEFEIFAKTNHRLNLLISLFSRTIVIQGIQREKIFLQRFVFSDLNLKRIEYENSVQTTHPLSLPLFIFGLYVRDLYPKCRMIFFFVFQIYTIDKFVK